MKTNHTEQLVFERDIAIAKGDNTEERSEAIQGLNKGDTLETENREIKRFVYDNFGEKKKVEIRNHLQHQNPNNKLNQEYFRKVVRLIDQVEEYDDILMEVIMDLLIKKGRFDYLPIDRSTRDGYNGFETMIANYKLLQRHDQTTKGFEKTLIDILIFYVYHRSNNTLSNYVEDDRNSPAGETGNLKNMWILKALKFYKDIIERGENTDIIGRLQQLGISLDTIQGRALAELKINVNSLDNAEKDRNDVTIDDFRILDSTSTIIGEITNNIKENNLYNQSIYEPFIKTSHTT